jgi:hypothetical protein
MFEPTSLAAGDAGARRLGPSGLPDHFPGSRTRVTPAAIPAQRRHRRRPTRHLGECANVGWLHAPRISEVKTLRHRVKGGMRTTLGGLVTKNQNLLKLALHGRAGISRSSGCDVRHGRARPWRDRRCQEIFRNSRDRLAPHGVAAFNIMPGTKLYDSNVRTLKAAFAQARRA